MNKKLLATSVVSLLVLPVVGLAFNAGSVPGLLPALSIPGLLDSVFNFLWPIIVAAVIILFILSGFLFLTAQGNPGQIATARLAVIWGVAGVVVILIAFSITAIIRTGLGGL